MSDKTKKIIYWVLTGLVAFVLIGSAMGKLLGGAQTADMAKTLGGSANMKLLGVLELVIAILWLIPRTGIVGALLAIAYLGGAIAVHFVNNQPIIIPVIIQAFIWVAAAYRFPELTKRLFNKQ